MTPYSITITSHLIFTLYYSLAFFIGINIIGILYQRENFFVLFLPEGVPIWIIPLLIIIEYVSYFARIFSLAIRLFANMMAGHVLMKILIGFVWSMISIGSLGFIVSIFPLIIIFCVTGLETAIAFLQSYVFIVLLSIYLNDVINTH
jgi:ATP synthase subunit 6